MSKKDDDNNNLDLFETVNDKDVSKQNKKSAKSTKAKSAKTSKVSKASGDKEHIKSLYPDATHPETMAYEKQENIGGVVETAPVKQEVEVKETNEAVVNETATQPITETKTPVVSRSYTTDITAGEIAEGTGGEAPVDKSVLYAGSNVSRNANGLESAVVNKAGDGAVVVEKSQPASEQTPAPVQSSGVVSRSYTTDITAGEITEGTGGDAPVDKSVLYSGSNVSRLENGLESVVVNKAGDGAVSVETSQPAPAQTPASVQSSGVISRSYTTDITAGEIAEGTGGSAPVEGSVLYAGSNVSRLASGLESVVVNKAGEGAVISTIIATEQETVSITPSASTGSSLTYTTDITAGEITEGTGGDAPVEGSVLYAGSNVSRLASGLESVVVSKAGEVVAKTENTAPTSAPYAQSQPTTAPYGQTSAPVVEDDEPDVMEYDVLIVGAGPAGLSTAIQIKKQAQLDGKEVSVCVVEKGSEVGSHILSGAVLEPRALNELIPDWKEKGAPLDTPAKKDKFLVLTKNKSIRMPTPPQMHNKGNYIISLGKFVNWLGTQAEEMGVEIYTSTAAAEILKEDGKVVGIKSGAFGIDKDGNKTAQYVEGMELRAKYTVMGEGVRGHLTKELFEEYELRNDCDPQTFGIGIKELWEIDPEKSTPGEIIHTAGWPLDKSTYGGSFLYHLEGNLVSVGFVIGLDYKNPHLFPYMEFQRFKHHPEIAKHLEGGRRISYGARAINEGGFQSIPKLTFKGGLIVGCSAGFVNVPKIKGTHTAMKSGMVAGLELYKAITSGETPDELTSYPEELEKSWLWAELKGVRNIRPSFHKFGFFGGMAYAGFTTVLGGREPWTFKNHDDHSGMMHKDKAKKIDYPQPDGVLSFDRLTNVAFSGTAHGADQPVHLQLKDKDIPISVNLEKYDMPETRFCPAGVYELTEVDGQPALQINSQNCVHCKTCDIKDPCQNINWVVPEGGNGPNYQGM